MSRIVYADNAATTKPYEAVISAMSNVLRNNYGNPSSKYSIGRNAKDSIELSRKVIADVIKAKPCEIYFTSGGSESNTQAILSMARIGNKLGKRHIVVSAIEHHSVLNAVEYLKDLGFEISYAMPEKTGIVSVDTIKNLIKESTCLVSVMTVNNETGNIQPIKEIGALCKERDILFHTDAVQAIGHIDVDVRDMNIDLLSSSAHKFHGVKGCGFLYARECIELSNIIFGGGQECAVRPGTENVAGIRAMSIALSTCYRSRETANNNLYVYRDFIYKELSKIDGFHINGSLNNRVAGNLNIRFDGVEGESLLMMLESKGVFVSTGSACNSNKLIPSHVLKALGLTDVEAFESIRITLGDDITLEDVKYMIEAIKDSVKFLRSFNAEVSYEHL